MSKHPEIYKVPHTRVCLMTRTSKMPCASFSLPAHKSCPRANGDICDDCYAGKNCYIYPNVKKAQDSRFKWTVESMRTRAGQFEWIRVMVEAISKTGLRYFRVHDSGDMFNAQYAECWYEVCAQLPDIRFWIPTRAYQSPSPLPVFDPLLFTLRKLAQLPNVTVRPSALNFGDYAPVIPGLHAGTTAAMPDVMRARQCPAKHQGGKCGECRTCWDSKDTPVSYSRH